MNNRTKGAFGNTSGGTGGTGSGTGQSQGVNYPGGNQGVPTGDPNAGTYGPGEGTGASGTRNFLQHLRTNSHFHSQTQLSRKGRWHCRGENHSGQNGRVTAAEPGQRGTTTMNPDLHDAAKRAALLPDSMWMKMHRPFRPEPLHTALSSKPVTINNKFNQFAYEPYLDSMPLPVPIARQCDFHYRDFISGTESCQTAKIVFVLVSIAVGALLGNVFFT